MANSKNLDERELEALLSAFSDASKRSHTLGALLIILSLGLAAVMWNYGLSWLNSFPLICEHDSSSSICQLDTTPRNENKDQQPKTKIEYEHTDVRKVLEKKLLEEWVESMFVTNEIIGIKFSVAEAALYCGCATYVLFHLLYLSTVKESYLLAEISRLQNVETSKIIKSAVVKCQIDSISRILSEIELEPKSNTPRFMHYLPVTLSLVSYAFCVFITIVAATVMPAHFRGGNGLSGATSGSLFLQVVFMFRILAPIAIGFFLFNQSQNIKKKQDKIEDLSRKIISFAQDGK